MSVVRQTETLRVGTTEIQETQRTVGVIGSAKCRGEIQGMRYFYNFISTIRSGFSVLVVAVTFCFGCQDSEPLEQTANPKDTGPDETSKARPAPREFRFELKKPNTAPPAPGPPISMPVFLDTAAANGLSYTYLNGAGPKALMVESTGGGGGWIDVDRDGALDLILPQGGTPDAATPEDRPSDVLFRRTPDDRYLDIAAVAGTDCRHYGQGVSVADFNNDGFADVLVTNVGPKILYLNLGDGTFADASSHLHDSKNVWSSSSAWGDIDLDGDLDLYVCNYAIYDPYHPVPCRDENGAPAICHPKHVEPEPDQFFLNLGDGEFQSAEGERRLFGDGNRGLGVVICDLTRDGWPDIYVCNDTTANFYFVNQGQGMFEESALRLGGAFSATGFAQASMGVAVADYDQNGFPDLCLTHFTAEHNTLYQNLGPGGLSDVSAVTGLRDITFSKLGFGILMQDFNFDTHTDMIIGNGHIDPKPTDGQGYEMVPQLLSFDGRLWKEWTTDAGDFFQTKRVARGVAMGDADNNGDPDVLIVSQNSPAALLENQQSGNHYLKFKFAGTAGSRDAVGTRVAVSIGDRKLYGDLLSGMSYASAHESAITFGLGAWDRPVDCWIRWPNGKEQTLSLSPDQTVLLIEGRTEPFLRFAF